jgi:hypothetical protein
MTEEVMVSEPSFNQKKLTAQAEKDQADEAELREGALEKPMGEALPQKMRVNPAKEKTKRPEPVLITLRLKPKALKPAAHAPAAANQAAGIEDKAEEMRQMQTYGESDLAPSAKSMEAAGRLDEPARPEEDLFKQIARMVSELNGHVVSVARNAEGRPASIEIGLPADQYDRFIEQLSIFGDYPYPPPKIGLPENQSVLVTIELLPPS